MRGLVFHIAIFALQLFLYYHLRFIPVWVEGFYSTGLYPYIGYVIRSTFGIIPFSLGDILYIVAIILIVRWLYYSWWALVPLSRKRNIQQSHYRKTTLGRYTQLFSTLNVVLVGFHILWGFNYYRQPLHKVLKLKADYTTQELRETIDELVSTSNALHQQLQQADSLAVKYEQTQEEIFAAAPRAYNNIEHIYPALDYEPSSIKKSLLTFPLSYMGYSGYLNPFTGEAHTNAYINNYKTPVLTLHEMAHQLGFAKENEANFIAIMAGLNHPDPYFQYSASIFALRYCLNDLYRRSPDLFERVKPSIRPGIYANYEELTEFWQQYEGIIEDVSQATYNTYLKANNQPGGMETYNYVVALVVNYSQQHGLDYSALM